MIPGLPDFPEVREVGLDLAASLGPFLRGLKPELSEHTFASLFLFRGAHRYRVSRWGELLLVLGHGYDGTPYAFPPLGEGDVEGAARAVGAHLAAQGVEPALFPVPRAVAEASFGGPEWEWRADRDQADYLYLREELATLPGQRFHKRKNRLAKFLREEGAGYRYEPLAAAHVPACRELAGGWCEVRCSRERPSTYQETEAAQEALTYREALGLTGAVILLGDRVRAFCLGEELNPETFVVHFEKTEPGLEGLAQAINRDFCLHGLGAYTYVNREQDLGDPGLRHAKEAYHPVRLVEKCRVRPTDPRGIGLEAGPGLRYHTPNPRLRGTPP